MRSGQEAMLHELDKVSTLISLHQSRIEQLSARRQLLWRELDHVTRPHSAAITAPPAHAECRPHRKKWPTILRVSICGDTIEHREAAVTFTHTLRLLGLERVSKLGRYVRGVPLVSRSPAPKYQQTFAQGWWITTHSSTSEKKEILDDLAEALGADVQVAVITRQPAR